MKSRITTHIDEVDKVKLERMAGSRGMTADEAARVILLHGVDFFLTKSVGATTR